MAWRPTISSGVWVTAMRNREFAAIVDWFNVWFFGSGVAMLLLVDLMVLSGGAGWAVFLRAASGGLMLAAAAIMGGWMLGLLFGIPRALSRPQPPSVAPAPDAIAPVPTAPAGLRTSRTNTNLEDVSDWLTKTIVGLGLVNLTVMPGYLWRAAGKIGPQVFPQGVGSESLVLLIAGYFAIGGFWLGYVGTRTMITLLFDFVDNGSEQKAVTMSADPNNLKVDPVTQQILPATDGLAEADKQVLGKPLRALNTVGEFAAWGAAKARAGDWNTAMTVLQETMKDAPNSSVVKRLLDTLGAAKP